MAYAPPMKLPDRRPLSTATRERVVRAAVAVVQADARHRGALLEKLPPVFVRSLPMVGVAETQVRQDLKLLESGKGAGLAGMRENPLTLWLEAGSVLGGAGWQGQAFRDGYAEVTGRRLPPPSVATQSEAVVSGPAPSDSLHIPWTSLFGFALLTAVCFGISWLIETVLVGG